MMTDIVKALIRFEQQYKITPSIRFQHDCGHEYVCVRFTKNRQNIERLFYFVPVGEGSEENFDRYNPCFEVDIEKMVEELLLAVEG